MPEWKNLYIDRACIRAVTDRSVLVSLPRYSEYRGFTFWHPKKLVTGEYDKAVLRYNDEFVFRLQKREKNKDGQWETVDQATLSGDEIAAIYSEEEPLIYTPKPLEPEEIEADESLVDDE